MATNKIITVTVIPTLSGDTIASYNAYSSIDGLLGAMTPAEGLAGKIFSLSDGAIHDITVKVVWTTAGETTTVGSNVVEVDLSVIDYKIVTSGSTDNDRLQSATGAEYLVLPVSGNWIIELKAKSLLATNAIRILVYGSVNNLFRLMSDGNIQYQESTGGIISDWESAQADLGATTTIGAFNDGLQHTYRLSWTVGDSGLKLSIDGVDFGVSTTANTAPIDTFTIFNYGSQSTREPWEFEDIKITIGATLYHFKLNEGSGTEANYEGGTDHTINLNTDNPTGQEARMWQTV